MKTEYRLMGDASDDHCFQNKRKQILNSIGTEDSVLSGKPAGG
jgi:hypothetical protein